MSSLNALLKALDLFDRGEVTEEVLTVELEAKDLPELTAWVNKLPGGERDVFLKRIKRFQGALETYKENMSKELSKIQQEIHTTRMAKTANVAYLKTAMGSGQDSGK